jgi:hypothetical protein
MTWVEGIAIESQPFSVTAGWVFRGSADERGCKKSGCLAALEITRFKKGAPLAISAVLAIV